MQEELITKQEIEEQKNPTGQTVQNQRLQLLNLLHELVAKNPDPYTQLIFELREALQTHFNQVSESKQKEQIKLVIGTIQQPLELLRWSNIKDYEKMSNDLLAVTPKKPLTIKDPVFKELNQVIEKLDSLHKSLNALQPLQKVCEQIQACNKAYIAFRQQLCTGNQMQRQACLQPTMRLFSATVRAGYLQFAPHESILDKLEKKTGNHPVLKYKGVYFKPYPDSPGTEYVVAIQNQQLLKQGIAPTELIKFERTVQAPTGNFIKETIPVLTSLAIEGPTFHDLLHADQKAYDYYKQHHQLPLDEEGFSNSVVMALRSHPYDGKKDNYIAEQVGDDKVQHKRPMAIDSDLSFADTVIKRNDGKHITNVRCFLLFQPQMQHEVAPLTRKKLQLFSPEISNIVLLQALSVKEAEVRELQKIGFFSEEELKKLNLPFRFVPGTVHKFYRQDRQLYTLAHRQGPLMHDDLFKAIDPALHAFYTGLLKATGVSPFGTLDAIRELFTNSAQREQSTGGITFEYLIKDEKLDREIRDTLKEELKQAKGFWDFMQNREQLIPKAKEELLETFDFSDLASDLPTDEAQRDVIDSLLSNFQDVTQLTFNNCTILGTQSSKNQSCYLLRLVKNVKHLKTLVLNNCNGLSLEIFQEIILERKGIHLCLSVHGEWEEKLWKVLLETPSLEKFSLLLLDGGLLQLKPKAADAHQYLHRAAACKAQKAIDFLITQGYAPLSFNAILTQLSEGDLSHDLVQQSFVWYLQGLQQSQASKEAYQKMFFQIPARPDVYRKLWLKALHSRCTQLSIIGNNDNNLSLLNKNLLTLVTEIKDESGYSLLHLAAWFGEIELVKDLLLVGISVHEKSANHSTPLHSAASAGHSAIVKLLLDNKADADAKNDEGQTPLFWATCYCHHEAMVHLLQKNATVDAVDNAGFTPLHKAILNFQNDPEEQAKAVQILIKYGVDVNAQDKQGLTPLHMAARFTRNLVIKELICAGANPEIKDKSGKTPANYADSNNKHQTAIFIENTYNIFKKSQAEKIQDLEKQIAELKQENQNLKEELQQLKGQHSSHLQL